MQARVESHADAVDYMIKEEIEVRKSNLRAEEAWRPLSLKDQQALADEVRCCARCVVPEIHQ